MKIWMMSAAAIAVLGACAATPLGPEELARIDSFASMADAPRTAPGVFEVRSERSPEALKMRPVPIGWAGGFSCNLGVTQMGDDAWARDRIARLEQALVDAFPGKAEGEVLSVRRYDIYVNRGAEADAQAWGAAMGSVGMFGVVGTPDTAAEKIWRAPKCAREKMAGGWFDPADLTGNAEPITVDIDVSVFGGDFVVNAAHSPELNGRLFVEAAGTQPQALEAMFQKTMAKAHQRLVDMITAARPDLATIASPPDAQQAPAAGASAG
jgi:hypothetical protein